MSTDPRSHPGPGPAGPHRGDEQEVDVGRLWWSVVARWWLVALCVALGILIGYLISLGGGRVFEAKATVYLGQPLSPSGNSQVQTLATNPATVNQIVRSESVVRAVAVKVGVPPEQLRAGVSSKAVAGAVAKAGQTSLVEIVVRGPWRRESAEAADALSQVVVERVSAYPEAKIARLEATLDSVEQELSVVESSVDAYEQQLEAASGLEPAERLAVVGLLNSAVQQRGQLLEDKKETELELALAQDVERASVVSGAAATKVSARSRQSSMIVGAVIGLVVGILLALAWEPLRRRLSRGA